MRSSHCRFRRRRGESTVRLLHIEPLERSNGELVEREWEKVAGRQSRDRIVEGQKRASESHIGQGRRGLLDIMLQAQRKLALTTE